MSLRIIEESKDASNAAKRVILKRIVW